MSYDEAVNFIHSRGMFGIKLGLDAITALLDKVGNPHNNLKFIHIAGTNGKGSTSSYIADILKVKGYKVGKFISPYVHSFTERIQINDEEISQDDLAKYTFIVKDAIEKYNLDATEFEAVTAIGFKYFEAMKCDYVVLEVGMGGRFDATNVISAPELAVITSISLDHTEYLGDTVGKIAFEKCGIIKNGTKNIIAYCDNPTDAADVIKNISKEHNVPLTIPNKNEIKIISQDICGTYFTYKGLEYHIKMLGKHQIYNAVSAIEAALKMGIEYEHIKTGIDSVVFRGRLEIISHSPFIITDGAHNLSGVTELKNALQTYFNDKKIILVMAMLKDKEYKKCLELICPLADTFIGTEADNPRKASAQLIADTAKPYVKEVFDEPDVNKAIKIALSKYDENSVICVCGSLYLLGAIDLKGVIK